MIVDKLDNSRVRWLAAALAVTAGLLVAAIAPATGSAQAPAICDQYPNLPTCVGNQPGGGGGGDAATPGDGGAGVDAFGSGSASGELPFTGYPLTPLVLLLLALLVAGAAIRAYVAARDRLHGSSRTV